MVSRNRTERRGMWSRPLCGPRTPPFEQVAVLRTYWSGRYEDSLAWDPVHLIPDRDASSVPGPESVPMACGPNVDQAGLYGFPVADAIGAPAGNQSRAW
jgi:hypothetical protein